MSTPTGHRAPRLGALGFLTLLLALGPAACGDGEGSTEGLEAVPGEQPPAGSQAGTAERDGEGERSARASPDPAPAIPAGTTLEFEVLETVSTSTHAPGDRFSLRLVEGVSGAGDAALRAGTRGSGTVVEARPSEDPDSKAVLLVEVRSVQVNGESRPISGTVQGALTRSSSADGGTRTAAKVVTGAAVGAVVGRILGGDTRSAARGAAVGTVAGLGVALTTRDGHATLARGSRITILLDDDLRVN